MKKIFVYSIGQFEALDDSFKEGKAIIRIHNKKNEEWYKDHIERNTIWLFFDDVNFESLDLKEKIIALYFNKETNLFSKPLAKKILKFIEKNLDKDFIIHCEYGRRRSVAVASFMKDCFSHSIENKTEQDLEKANTLVLKLLALVNS